MIDRILVRVNSRAITQGAFDQRLLRKLREEGKPPAAEPSLETRRAAMEELVNEALLEDRARELGLSPTDAEVEDFIRKLKEQNQVATDAEFGEALAASGLTVDGLREQLRRSMAIQRVVGREVHARIDLGDDVLRLAYERSKERWKLPERARLSEILVPDGEVSGEAKAAEAARKLKAGAKFEDVVSRYSSGATRDRGGDLGYVSKGELSPEIDRVVFSLPAGAVTDPIPTKTGWHVILVVDRLPVSTKPFDAVKADLVKEERDRQFPAKLAETLDRLKRDAEITVSAEAAGLYSPSAPGRPPAPAELGPTPKR